MINYEMTILNSSALPTVSATGGEDSKIKD